MVVLTNADESQATYMSNKILKAISDIRLDHKSSPISLLVTLSMGIYTCTKVSETQVLPYYHKADSALYQAKNSGRNKYDFYAYEKQA